MAIVKDLSGNAVYPKQVPEQHIGGYHDIPSLRPIGDSQEVTTVSGGVDVAFRAPDNRATHLRITGDEANHWSYNRAATQTDPVLPADVVEYFRINEGDIIHLTAQTTGGAANAQGMY